MALRLSLRLLVRMSRLLVLSTLALALASALVAPALRTVLGQVAMPDFIAHYTGGRLAADPARLYDIDAQRALQTGWLADPSFLNLFLSPPWVAPLYAPLARLPLARAMAAWLALSCLCLALAHALLRRAAAPFRPSHERLFVLFALAFQPLQEALGSGQDTPVTLLLWAAGVRLALDRRDLGAGLVLGLGVVKPQLFLLPLLHLLVARRWRAVAGAAASGGLLVAGAWLHLGPAAFRAWLAILSSPTYLHGIRQAQLWKMHSLVASLEALAPPAWGPAARGVGHALALALAAATLRLAARMPPRRAWALLAVASVIVSPHLFSYDLSLLLVAALLRLGDRWTLATRRAALATAALVWLSALRAGLVAGRGWPLSALAGSWTPLALLVLWRELARRPPGGEAGGAPQVD